MLRSIADRIQIFKEDSNQVLNPYLESHQEYFNDLVRAASQPLVPEPVEEPILTSAEELDKCVEFFHTSLTKYGQQVLQHIAQVCSCGDWARGNACYVGAGGGSGSQRGALL